jgi:hypothetical protein
MTLQIEATARKLKITTLLDPAPFAALGPISDNAPSRTVITVEVAGRTVHADVATRSIRRAVKAIEEHGADGVTLLLQGSLAASGAINEAGLAAQPR